jgi:hypothetical protein
MTTAENRSKGLFDAVQSHLSRKDEVIKDVEKRKEENLIAAKQKAELELFLIENM